MSENRFPLFIDLTGKKVAVIGAGKIGMRRVKTLLLFGADVTIIDPALDTFPEGTLWKRPYRSGDLEGFALAVAASGDREVNHAAAMEAKGRHIPISVADCQAECDYYFPAVAVSGALTVGLVSSDGDHHRTSGTAKKIRELLEDTE